MPEPTTPSPPRRRPRGPSLRTLMALVLVLGGGLGYLAYRARVQRLAVAAIEAAGGKVDYDWQWADGVFDPRNPRPRRPKWLVDGLGADYFDTVVAVHLGGPGIKADDPLMAQVGRLSHLGLLALNGNPAVTDAGLAHLRGLARLRDLDLDSTGVRGPGLAHLTGMTRLESLDLSRCTVADADLAHLAGLKSLKVLSLDGRGITDAGLAHLAGLTKLERLRIWEGPVTAGGLAHLRGLVRLESLALNGTKVASLEPLRHLDLDSLNLLSTPIDDDGLAPVAAFRSLGLLDLSDTRVGDAGLAHLAGLSSLDSLDLAGSRVTDAGLAHLARLPALGHLNLGRTAITDAGLSHLARLHRLVRLSLNDTKVTDAGLAHFAGLARLAELDLRRTAVSQAGATSATREHPGMRVVR